MKCISLLFLLRLLGLEPLFNFDPFPNFIDNRCYKCKIVLNWTYSFFILLLVSYQPVFETVLTIKYEIINNLPNTLFYYIIPIHYYIAFIYFRSQRKKRIYESQNIEFLDNGNGFAKCMPGENTLIKSVSIISCIVILEEMITFFIFDDPELYEHVSDIVYLISKIIISLSFLPGRLILVINSHVFFFSFLQQLQKIQDLKKKLKIRDWRENKKSSVAILCYEIIDIRYTISRLIQKTEAMYITTTLIGGVSIGLILEFNEWHYRNIISFVIFGLMQIIFLSVINCIGKTRDDINKIVHRRSFASKYILRKNDFCQACLNVEKKFTDIRNSKDNIFNSLDNVVNGIIEHGVDNIEENKDKKKDCNTPDQSPESEVRIDIEYNKGSSSNNGPNSEQKNINGDDVDTSLQEILEQRQYLNSIIKNKKSVNKNDENDVYTSTDSTKSLDIKKDTELKEIKTSPLQFRKRQLNSTYNLNDQELHVLHRKRSIGSSDDIFKHKPSDSLEDSTEIRRNINALLDSRNGSTYLADSGCYLTTDEYIRCIYEWTTNTGSSVDWIILNSLLNENWSSFGLFGVKFSDGKALINAVITTSTIIASGSLLGSFVSAINFFG